VCCAQSAFMKVYRSYIVNYQPAHDLLKKLSKEDKKFAEFLDVRPHPCSFCWLSPAPFSVVSVG
jgi:hypothetical protein